MDEKANVDKSGWKQKKLEEETGSKRGLDMGPIHVKDKGGQISEEPTLNNEVGKYEGSRNEDSDVIGKILEPLGLFKTSSLEKDVESREYGGSDVCLNGQRIKFRCGKITPTKNGQFVTLWARDGKGTRPYDEKDGVELIVVTIGDGAGHGHFMFPKTVLMQRGIISSAGKGGKRGIRVYPPWVRTESKQASATQDWQVKYFLGQKGKEVDLAQAGRLLGWLIRGENDDRS